MLKYVLPTTRFLRAETMVTWMRTLSMTKPWQSHHKPSMNPLSPNSLHHLVRRAPLQRAQINNLSTISNKSKRISLTQMTTCTAEYSTQASMLTSVRMEDGIKASSRLLWMKWSNASQLLTKTAIKINRD